VRIWTLTFRFALCLVAVLVAACSASGDAADVSTEGPFESGEFQLTVDRVEDACFDGGLSLLFMPNGTVEPYPLTHLTWIPGLSDVPASYVVQLAAPFNDMSLLMEANGAGGLQARGAQQPGVLLGLPGSDDCTGDLVMDVDVAFVSVDQIIMTTRVTVQNLRSETDTCAPPESDPCEVQLFMSGLRVNVGALP